MPDPYGEASVESGQRLADRYQLTEPLGRGGMGQVWRGLDLTLDRPVAVKVLLGGLSGEDLERELARFRREGRAAARLNHPVIATIYDSGEDKGRLFLVFELVDGRDLGTVLAGRPSGLPVGQVLDLGARIADGLAVAHQAGVIHRDIKPANVMLLDDGAVKICDFGVARLQGATASLSATGAIVGTVSYMSPEQLQARPLSGSTDVYALGATLFHLLTGHLVFPFDSLHAIIAAHLTAPPPDPETLRPDCPPEFGRYLLRMLGKRPDQRPDAADIARTLRAMMPGDAQVNEPPGTMPSRAGPGFTVSSRLPSAGMPGPRVLTIASSEGAEPVSVTAVAFRPDGRTLASGDSAHHVRTWDVSDGRQLAVYSEQPDGVFCTDDVVFNPAGTVLASAICAMGRVAPQDKSRILLRDTSSGQVIARLTGVLGRIGGIAFSPDGRLLAGATNLEMGVWDVSTGRVIAVERGFWPHPAFSPDGKTLAAGWSEKVRLWEVGGRGRFLDDAAGTLDTGVPHAVSRGIAFSPDGTMLAAAVIQTTRSREGGIFVWNPPTGRLLTKLAQSEDARSVIFSPGGDVIAGISSSDKSVTLWDVSTGCPVGTVDTRAAKAISIAFSPDGTVLAAGCMGEIQLWPVPGAERA